MIKSDILLHNSIKTSPHKLCGVKYEIQTLDKSD